MFRFFRNLQTFEKYKYYEIYIITMSIQFVVDETGKKTGVFLPIAEYEELLEMAEDNEALLYLKSLREKPLETRSFDEFFNEYSNNV